eukprot:gene8092-10297_t
MNFQIRQSVKVINAKHKRHGEAGIVEAIDTEAQKVKVKFDTPDPDGEVVELKAADLVALT